MGSFGKKRMAFIRERKRSRSIGIRLSGGATDKKQWFTALLLNKLYTIIGIIKEGGRQGQIRGNKVYMICGGAIAFRYLLIRQEADWIYQN